MDRIIVYSPSGVITLPARCLFYYSKRDSDKKLDSLFDVNIKNARIFKKDKTVDVELKKLKKEFPNLNLYVIYLMKSNGEYYLQVPVHVIQKTSTLYSNLMPPGISIGKKGLIFGIYSIESILSKLNKSNTIYLDGDVINISNKKLYLFKNFNKCAICGKEAVFFIKRKETKKSTNFVLNLFTIKNGKFVLMNTDHIVPKSYIKDDSKENLQLTCYDCNCVKGNNVEFKEKSIYIDIFDKKYKIKYILKKNQYKKLRKKLNTALKHNMSTNILKVINKLLCSNKVDMFFEYLPNRKDIQSKMISLKICTKKQLLTEFKKPHRINLKKLLK